MPYFKRVPYAEMQAPATAGAPADAAGAEDIVALAAGVLGLGPTRGAAPEALGPRQPLRAGTSGSFVLDIRHQPGTPPVATGIIADDLHGPAGRIPSAAVALQPDRLTLADGAGAEVRVSVAVPAGTPPGRYLGLLRSEIDDGFAERIAVEVTG